MYSLKMKNLNSEENNMCKFNCCPYYDFEYNECSRDYCIKIMKTHNH